MRFRIGYDVRLLSHVWYDVSVKKYVVLGQALFYCVILLYLCLFFHFFKFSFISFILSSLLVINVWALLSVSLVNV